jgi:rhamnose transport system permease protein
MRFLAPREFPALAALVLSLVFLAVAAPAFYSPDNLRDTALSTMPVLLTAIGMTLVIVCGQIDISVGSIFAICSVVCGALSLAGVPAALLPVASLLAGALLGSLNGLMTAYLRAPSIVVTLATMVVFREALRWVTGGAWIQNLPPSFQWFGLGQAEGQTAILLATLAVFALFAWCARGLSAFRFIYATGSDADAARLAGIDTARVVFWVFVLTGALTGLAALLNAVRFADVPANSGMNLELKAIAAVVVGGASITGGRGTLRGTLIGVILLGAIGPALTFLGVSPYWEKAIQGAIILATVLFDSLAARAGRRMVPA